MEYQFLNNNMKEKFVKKYWNEEEVLFYIHFQNGKAVRQIEVTHYSKIKLSSINPINENSMLYDQELEDLDLNENDFILEEEFNKIWIEL